MGRRTKRKSIKVKEIEKRLTMQKTNTKIGKAISVGRPMERKRREIKIQRSKKTNEKNSLEGIKKKTKTKVKVGKK